MVRFEWPTGLASIGDLGLPTGTDAVVTDSTEGRVVEIRVTDPTALLYRLTGWAVDHAVELERLEVVRPSLEDVYLRITADEASSK
jgi:ABC-2 type transport system ATP-binding protein